MQCQSIPQRIVVNFAQKCSLNCEWCYIPFGNIRAEASMLMRIIEEVSIHGFKTVTIGGGDPFQYGFIGDLLKKAKEKSLFVHVDTNANCLVKSKQTFSLIRDYVDLIGLPLDGATAHIHDGMRSKDGHFNLVMRCIEWLGPLQNRLKINTMISKRNIQQMFDLCLLINKLAPIRWSIYQFMPIGPATLVSDDYSIGDSHFRAISESLTCSFITNKQIAVEISDCHSRKCTYPIIHHDGSVYVHSDLSLDGLLQIGNIFDNGIRAKIIKNCKQERSTARSRYEVNPLTYRK